MCIYHKNMQLVQFCKISTSCVWGRVLEGEDVKMGFKC